MSVVQLTFQNHEEVLELFSDDLINYHFLINDLLDNNYHSESFRVFGEFELFYFAHYAFHCELFPEIEEVLIELSKKYRLAVISNAMPSMDWIFDRLKILKYFDSIILSAHVIASKPDEAII